ncbi:MAG: hypothetical protein AB7V22_10770, partial [Kiritimatiellia bacterium]
TTTSRAATPGTAPSAAASPDANGTLETSKPLSTTKHAKNTKGNLVLDQISWFFFALFAYFVVSAGC